MPVIKDVQEIDGEEVTILIEVDHELATESIYGNNMRGEREEQVLAKVQDLFGDGLKLVQNCAIRSVNGIKAMGEAIRPDEFEIQLAVKLDAEAGAVLAKAGTEAQMQVTMKWQREKLEAREREKKAKEQAS